MRLQIEYFAYHSFAIDLLKEWNKMYILNGLINFNYRFSSKVQIEIQKAWLT